MKLMNKAIIALKAIKKSGKKCRVVFFAALSTAKNHSLSFNP